MPLFSFRRRRIGLVILVCFCAIQPPEQLWVIIAAITIYSFESVWFTINSILESPYINEFYLFFEPVSFP